MKRHSMHRKQAIVWTRMIFEHAVRLSRAVNWRHEGFMAAKKRYEDEITQLHRELDEARHEIEISKNIADEVYAERNRLVAFLSKLLPASLERHKGENWGPEWGWVCYIDSFVGQLSWHIKTSELYLFDHLERNTGLVWDGHSTEEKYKRIESYPAPVWSSSDPESPSEIELANAEISKLRAELEEAEMKFMSAGYMQQAFNRLDEDERKEELQAARAELEAVKGRSCRTCSYLDYDDIDEYVFLCLHESAPFCHFSRESTLDEIGKFSCPYWEQQ